MKIRFLGAAKTSAGSRHLLEIIQRRLLLDCGIPSLERRPSKDISSNSTGPRAS